MKIGICGRSGSGKSTASSYFADKGYQVIDLDLYAKSLDNKYPEILDRIKMTFGPQIIKNGIINRKILGEIVFGSSVELNKLNEIYFEFLRRDMIELIKNNENIVVEGAVIFEIGLDAYLDKILFMIADETKLLERISHREKSNLETLKNRLKIQKKYDVYIDKADYTIETNGTKEELYEKLDELIMENG
ncbi:MAG: dephospho-CoA kinase [Candidatus Delongbacteria bacterium]|nr:dephospho-CoA kinase [Candidatus Delongbacteria bacterium]